MTVEKKNLVCLVFLYIYYHILFSLLFFPFYIHIHLDRIRIIIYELMYNSFS